MFLQFEHIFADLATALSQLSIQFFNHFSLLLQHVLRLFCLFFELVDCFFDGLLLMLGLLLPVALIFKCSLEDLFGFLDLLALLFNSLGQPFFRRVLGRRLGCDYFCKVFDLISAFFVELLNLLKVSTD